MANVPLKSIKFPDLSDTYTIPQIDDTLAVAGKAADSKAAGDAIADVEAKLTADAGNIDNQLYAYTGEEYLDGTNGSMSDSTFSAVKTGDILKLNGTYTASTRRRFKITGTFANSTSAQSDWYGTSIKTLPSGKVYTLEVSVVGGSVTFSAGDTNTAANVFMLDTSGNTIASAYLTVNGWGKYNAYIGADVNVGCIYVTVNKNYPFSNYEIMVRIKEEDFSDTWGYVDAASGDDTFVGIRTAAPTKTIGKALQLGYRKLFVKPGVYNENIDLTGGKFEIVPWVDGQAYDSAVPYRPKIKLIRGTKLTVSSTATTGVYQASYTAAEGSNIYKVFVGQTVDPTASGSLALEYNALLVEDMPNTSTATTAFSPYRQQLYTPVLTEEELSAEGTFWYDGTNHLIKFHAWNDTAGGEYYIPADESSKGIRLDSMKSVHLEDVKILGCYDYCAYIKNCDDVVIKACEFGYCAKGMGLGLDYANARVSDCHAYAISVDGFNLHGYGHSEIVGCTAFYCGDDGISHHQGCSGFIDGGEWAYCTSGGITPAFGSQIDVHNVYAHHNGYGIEWVGDSSQSRYTKMSNCLAIDNTTDIYVKWYVVTAWNCVYSTKNSQYSSARSNLIEYGTVTPT